MTVRQTRLALRIVTIFLVVAAGVCLTVGVILPLQTPNTSMPGQFAGPTRSQATRLPVITSYSPIFTRSLQATGSATGIAGAPAQAESQLSEPMVLSQCSLVGTIGNSVALIREPDGTVGMVETGDDVNGAPVLAIRNFECDLRVNGKLVTLRMPPTPSVSGLIVPSK